MTADIVNLLEFEVPEVREKLDERARSSYRVQVRGQKNFFLVVDSIRYRLLDVGYSGVSIAVESQPALYVDNIFSNCDLILGQELFENLDATVVHITPGSEGTWVCGVSLGNICAGMSSKIEVCLESLREEIFCHETEFKSWR